MKHPKPTPPSNAPTGTQWFGGPIGWFNVSLFIKAEDLVPRTITEVFRVEPDFSQQKDIPLLRPDGSVKRVPKFGLWRIELTQKQTDEWDVEGAAWLVLRRLPEDLAVWRALPEGCELRLSVALALQSANQGLSLESGLVRYLADRNIAVDLHVYAEDKDSA